MERRSFKPGPTQIDEEPNLYEFVENRPISGVDYLGQNEIIVSGGCNLNKGGWDINGPIQSGVELPGRIARKLGAPVRHDVNWKNFIQAAEAEIQRRKNKLAPGEKIEWHVEVSSYIARADADGAKRFSYLEEIKRIAEQHDVILRWLGTTQGFIEGINFAPASQTGGPQSPREGGMRISRFAYFGHGKPGH